MAVGEGRTLRKGLLAFGRWPLAKEELRKNYWLLAVGEGRTKKELKKNHWLLAIGEGRIKEELKKNCWLLAIGEGGHLDKLRASLLDMQEIRLDSF